MEKRIITVEVKNVYGNDVLYPVDAAAKHFADIAGTKTLRPSDIRLIELLGYEILLKAPSIPSKFVYA